MSTRSSISMIKEDGSVSQVYCHWDGYISNNGIILFNYYQNVDKIKKLISLGDMSSLKPEVEPNGYHTYNSPQDNVTIFYGRDRGEKNTKPQQFKNIKEFLQGGNFEGYNYVYKEKSNKWYLLDRREHKLKALKGLVKKELSKTDKNYKQDFLELIEKQKEGKELNISAQTVTKLKV